jgi:TonB family protein
VAARAAALDGASYGDDENPLPDDIRALLQRSLAESPDDRFSSAVDFKKELDRLLYGGAYSPTTFNLALFMDRLFRAEIEAEEGERAREQRVDVRAYLEAAKDSEPIIEEAIETPKTVIDPRLLRIGGGAAAAVAVAVAAFFLIGGPEPSTPAVPPTPTAAEIEAQRQAQDEKMRQLAESLVAEMMAEKEQEIRQELSDRQARIEELQRRLAASERRAREGELSREELQRQQELQRQIAAAEEAQRQQEADLEVERQRAAEEALAQVEPEPIPAETGGQAVAAAAGAATASGSDVVSSGTASKADHEQATAPAATAVAVEPSPKPTAVPTLAPTAVPTSPPTATPRPAAVATNQFVDPTVVDSLPVVIKEEDVVWPRAALMSRRQGVVIMQVTVNADGRVEAVTVLRADHEGFGIPQAATEAAFEYRFKPGKKDGVRVATYATITKAYNFLNR